MHDSEQDSWAWVTASRKLSSGPCELIGAFATAAAAVGSATLYNGENTRGELIIILEANTNVTNPFAPAKPIYCRRGLYVAKSANLTGVLVQWKDL